MAIYKWREDWWTPWATTVAYRPLKTDYNDYSWNGYNLTANGWVSLTTIDGVSCAKWWTSATSYLQSNDVQLPSGDAQRTVSFWYREVITSWTHHIFNYGEDATYKRFWMQSAWSSFRMVGGGSEYGATGFTLTIDNWYHIILTYDGTQTLPLYSYKINWTATGGQNWTLNTTAVSSDYPLRLFWAKWSTYYSRWYLSEVIVENRVWTDAEILAYYNANKGNYGIS